ncbi:MAG: hypothetical protein OXG35_20080 [Acidobacteria bacterium]|nr:hypothetical protein [Acidobacteriota bacterium]
MAAETVDEIDREIRAQRSNIKRRGRFIDDVGVRPAVAALERFLRDRTAAVAVLFRAQRELDVLTSVAPGGTLPEIPKDDPGPSLDRLYGAKNVVGFRPDRGRS